MLSFGLLFNAVLLAFGVYWCYEMFGRWRSDLEEFREAEDNTRRAVILGLWILTLLIALLVLNFAIAVILDIVWGIRALF